MATVEERLAALEVHMENKCATLLVLADKLDKIHEDILVTRARQEQRQKFYNWAIKLLWIAIPFGMWLQGGDWRELSGFFKTHAPT
jgi:hypothetical protein